jgi:hypothetical protein
MRQQQFGVASQIQVRRVAKAMTQAGRRVHFATIARWRSQNWRPVASGPHPVQAAREALEVAARLLTGDPATGAAELVSRSKVGEQLGGLSDSELLRRSTRELLILQIVLCKVMCRTCETLRRRELKGRDRGPDFAAGCWALGAGPKGSGL